MGRGYTRKPQNSHPGVRITLPPQYDKCLGLRATSPGSPFAVILYMNYSLLRVEDDAVTVALFKRALRQSPFRLRVATNSDEAFLLLRAQVPAMVVADYWLPGMNGLEFLSQVRHLHPKLKAILHTAGPFHPPSQSLDIPVLAKPCSEPELQNLFKQLESSQS